MPRSFASLLNFSQVRKKFQSCAVSTVQCWIYILIYFHSSDKQRNCLSHRHELSISNCYLDVGINQWNRKILSLFQREMQFAHIGCTNNSLIVIGSQRCTKKCNPLLPLLWFFVQIESTRMETRQFVDLIALKMRIPIVQSITKMRLFAIAQREWWNQYSQRTCITSIEGRACHASKPNFSLLLISLQNPMTIRFVHSQSQPNRRSKYFDIIFDFVRMSEINETHCLLGHIPTPGFAWTRVSMCALCICKQWLSNTCPFNERLLFAMQNAFHKCFYALLRSKRNDCKRSFFLNSDKFSCSINWFHVKSESYFYSSNFELMPSIDIISWPMNACTMHVLPSSRHLCRVQANLCTLN